MPLIGVVFALFAILVGNMLEGGHLGSLVGGPAALIVLGGTAGAVMVQFPFPVLGGAMKSAAGLFKKSPVDPAALLNEIVGFATQARKGGLLSLEKSAEGASDPFLKKALMMAVDGADSTALRDTMETAIEHEEAEVEEHAKAFEAAGGYCPTVGIVGAVLGLIHVMSNLADINAVGTGIAAAFVATIYGVAAANILFLPIAGRIKARAKEVSTARQMVLSGVLAVQGGLNPKVVRERLREFIPHSEQKKIAA
jgi:chemotaxis protein MotA